MATSCGMVPVTSEVIIVVFIILASLWVVISPCNMVLLLVIFGAFYLIHIHEQSTLKFAGWVLWLVAMVCDMSVLQWLWQSLDADGIGDEMNAPTVILFTYIRDFLLINMAVLATTAGVNNTTVRYLYLTIQMLAISLFAGGRGYALVELLRVAIYLVAYRLVYVYANFRHDCHACTVAWLATGWVLFCTIPGLFFVAVPVAVSAYRNHCIMKRNRGIPEVNMCTPTADEPRLHSAEVATATSSRQQSAGSALACGTFRCGTDVDDVDEANCELVDAENPPNVATSASDVPKPLYRVSMPLSLAAQSIKESSTDNARVEIQPSHLVLGSDDERRLMALLYGKSDTER